MTMNYQGVLRDAADKPRTGTFDMVFRFFDAQTAGSVLIVDQHTAAAGGMVAVTNGLFDVQLGTGILLGAGGGLYLSLADMFRDYTYVWMEITIGAETLSPRLQIQASAYALNAGRLQGRPASSFLDTSWVSQNKSGSLWMATTFPDAVTGSYYGATGMLGSAAFNTAVYGYGGSLGGLFSSTSGSETTLANDTKGVRAVGQSTGGSFANNAGGGSAILASGRSGISASGQSPGSAGHFEERVYSGRADLCQGGTGLAATGSYIAGRFIANISRFTAELGNHSWEAGGAFSSPVPGIYTIVADAYGFGVASNATKAFLQNHPTDPGRLMAYVALEGPEAGTYTRGSGSLRGGEARITLDPTFALTTNPDIGLTAVVTPRRARADLYVASVSTQELVVRTGAAAADEVAFDYVVNGLRVGFENQAVILESARFPSATVPSAEVAATRLAAMPEDVRASTPLARLSAERARSGGGAPDLAGARALLAGINSPEHALHARPLDAGSYLSEVQTEDTRPSVAPSAGWSSTAGRTSEPDPTPRPRATAAPGEILYSFSMPVAMEVQPGDVLSNDPAAPGSLHLAEEAGDPAVVGVVVGPPGARLRDQATIALAGTIVPCNADASGRPIAVGDLLVASPTPGFAMSAETDPRPGTVIGKALEPLAAGTGTIHILVMSR